MLQEKHQLGEITANWVHFLPIQLAVAIHIIQKEQPDGIIVSIVSQTALNVGKKLWELQQLQTANVQVLGTPIFVYWLDYWTKQIWIDEIQTILAWLGMQQFAILQKLF